MKYEMSSQDKAFLTLALKVASGHATTPQRIELEKLIRDQPRYRKDFKRLNEGLTDEKQNQFWISAIRVLLKIADPAEAKMIESLKETDPGQWGEFQDAVEFLTILASRQEAMKTMKIQPMPAHIREDVLSGLKAWRTRRGRP